MMVFFSRWQCHIARKREEIFFGRGLRGAAGGQPPKRGELVSSRWSLVGGIRQRWFAETSRRTADFFIAAEIYDVFWMMVILAGVRRWPSPFD
jgi:hypothetical protein